MEQGKRAGTDPAATAQSRAPHVAVPIAERSGRMITPRDILGVTVVGTHNLKGISVRDLRILFKAATEPFQTPDTTWFIGGGAGVDAEFLTWLQDMLAGYIHVVVPRTLAEAPLIGQQAIETAAKRWKNPHDFKLTELNGQGPRAHYARIRWVLDQSQALIAFPRDEVSGNSTPYAITYATSLGLPRIIWPVGK